MWNTHSFSSWFGAWRDDKLNFYAVRTRLWWSITATEQNLGAAMGGSFLQLTKAGFGVRLNLSLSPEWTLGEQGTLQSKAVSSLRSGIKTQPPDTAVDGKEQHDKAGAPSLALEDFSESLGKTDCTWPTQMPPRRCHHLCRTNQLPYGYECHCTPHVWETPRETQYRFQWNRFSFGNLVGGEFCMTNFVSCYFGVIRLTTKQM